MRVLICGGRDYCNADQFVRFMTDFICRIGGITTVIQGEARGADAMAKEWAKQMNIPTADYKADWNQYGKSAGYKRNLQMAIEGKPDHIIAFPGGVGTKMMIKIGHELGIPITLVGQDF